MRLNVIAEGKARQRRAKYEGPKALLLPERARMERAFKEGAQQQAWKDDAPVLTELSRLELSIEHSLANGRMKCISATYWRPDGKNMVLEHMMPMGAGVEDFLNAATMHGKNAQKICAKLAYSMLEADIMPGGQN